MDYNRLKKSIIAVPPAPLSEDSSVNGAEMTKLLQHIRRGGVSSVLIGGNANLYNMPEETYRDLLEFVHASTGDDPDMWILPSAGPDYDRLMKHARLFQSSSYPMVMVLPLAFPATPLGTMAAIKDFVQASGCPVMIYVKSENYLNLDDIEAMVAQGDVAAIKYAVPRADLTDDPFLEGLVDVVGPNKIVSGFGEAQGVTHLRHFGLAGFTAGATCIAPRTSLAVWNAAQARNWEASARALQPIAELEKLRDLWGPIPVLHDAVTMAGIADAGPQLPPLSGLEAEQLSSLREALLPLVEHERALETGGSEVA